MTTKMKTDIKTVKSMIIKFSFTLSHSDILLHISSVVTVKVEDEKTHTNKIRNIIFTLEWETQSQNK